MAEAVQPGRVAEAVEVPGKVARPAAADEVVCECCSIDKPHLIHSSIHIPNRNHDERRFLWAYFFKVVYI